MVAARKSSGLRVVRGERAEKSSQQSRDERLTIALAGGDPLPAGELYDHLIAPIEAALFRVVGRRGIDHDDLVQSNFEQVVITLRKKRFAGGCSLRSWAAAIATNIALNSLRTRRTEGKYFDRGVDTTSELGMQCWDDLEREIRVRRDVDLIREELAALPKEQAQTLVLHDALGYELSEISVLTGVSGAAAQSRLVRGRKKLRQRLLDAGLKLEREP